MFFQKKQQQPDQWRDFVARLDSVVADAVSAGISLESIAGKLSSRADNLNVQHEINKPWPGYHRPMTRIEEKLTPAQQEALRREALGLDQ